MDENKINIVFLGNQIAWGGGAKSLLLMIQSLSIMNFKLYLFVTHCANKEMKAEFEKYVEFVKIISLPEIVSAQTQNKEDNIGDISLKNIDYSSVELFADELNALDAHILHLNNSVFSPIYQIIKERTNVKIVTHIREWINWGGVHSKQEYIINQIKQYSDAIVCISDNEAVPFLSHKNCKVIPNPFVFDECKPNLFVKGSSEWEICNNRKWFIVGMMASFQENKGILDFLKALVYIKHEKQDANNIKFVFVGKDMKKGNLCKYYLQKMLRRNTFFYKVKKFIEINRLEDEIIFLQNTKEVNKLISCFDVAVRPSYSGDPWGRDIIEYMALGLPVVATGSSEFFIKNGVTGHLVKPRDTVQLAEKIYSLFRDKDKRENMGINAYNYIKQKCRIDLFRQRLIFEYMKLLA